MRMRSIPRRSSWRHLGTLARLGLLSGLAGCSEIQPVAPADEPITDPAQLYMRLTLDHPAINLSTAPGYTTIQLTATPRDALGNAMPGLPVATFLSRDTTKVRVTAEGLVTAVGTTTGAKVIASLKIGPVTHTDSALINVTSTASPPKLASLSLDPVWPDSGVWAMFFDDSRIIYDGTLLTEYFSSSYGPILGDVVPSLAPRAVDSAGMAMEGLALRYTSLDPKIAKVDENASIYLIRPGQVRLVVQTTAYGITKADTATFTVLPSLARSVAIYRGPAGTVVFDPSEVVIPPHGMVSFANYTTDVVDVVFDDPTNTVAGPASVCDDIVFWAGFTYFFFGPGSSCGVDDALLPGILPNPFNEPPVASIHARQFPVAGTYSFRSLRTGASGRVVVNANP